MNHNSVEAAEQTEGFTNGFKLAFEDPTEAHSAYKQCVNNGTIPPHGKGPWVVFAGRRQGVFTSLNDLLASVSRYPGNIYRCCESVEEGQQTLDKYLHEHPGTPAQPSAKLPVLTLTPPLAHPTVTESAIPSAERPILDAPADDSWWCCFAGAEPSVYHGVENLAKARPAPGGVCRVNSEEDGWKLWTSYLTKKQV